MKVWICQCLCPARHCITAAFDEAEDRAEATHTIEAPLREIVDDWVARGTINGWCGLCRAPRERWVFELAPTRFATMAEAEPLLRRGEAEQRVAAAIFGDLGQRPN